jgi:hypothetical protein
MRTIGLKVIEVDLKENIGLQREVEYGIGVDSLLEGRP